jgi:hypothetical protein
MRVMRKSFVLVFALILMMSSVWPLTRTSADGHIYRVSINNAGSYLIAGNSYSFSYTIEKAPGTIYSPIAEYSVNNGLTWNNLGNDSDFILPIDPQLTSAIFRLEAYFTPFVGSDSYSEQTIGPIPILQPGSATDVIATPNENGIVTLTWTDNSNMESYYQITRNGPDGTKTFVVNNTTDHIGPLSFIDNKTAIYSSTIYAYSVLPVIDYDVYFLPDNNKPGIVSVLVKTIAKKLTVDDNFDALKDNHNYLETNKSKLQNELEFSEKWGNYLLYIDKVAVSSVSLDKKSISLLKGESAALAVTVVPSDAADKKVTWSSDNKEIANVDSSGKVTGLSRGTTKISVKTDNGGFTSVCIVTVTEKQALPEKTTTAFTDTIGHWAEMYITKAVSLGFVSGYPDGTFRPNEGITRAEFTSMLMKGIQTVSEGTPLTFKDNKDIGDWAVKSVQQAVRLGIISGYSDGTFRPKANITHAEMISMIIRASGIPTDKAQPTNFADDADIPKWAKASVSTAEKNGIIIVSGITDNKFAPQAKSTRAESASAIVQMLNFRA